MNVQRKQRSDNPFTEQDEDDKGKAEPSGDIERVKTAADEEKDDKVVSVEAPEKDDDEHTPRQERRRERYDTMKSEKEAAERRAIEAEHRAAALLAQRQVQPQEKAKDPFEEEEKQIKSDFDKHLAYADAMKQATPEEVSKWRGEWFTIQQRSQALAAKRVQRESAGASGPVNMEEEVTKAHIRMKHGDIVGNPRVQMMADGIIYEKLAREGRTRITLDDYDYALNETRRRLRLPGGTAPRPSEETRQKFSGNGLGGASNSSSGREGRSEIRMTAEMQEMAEAQYKWGVDKQGKKVRLKPEEAHAKWAQNAGKKVLAKHG